MKRAAVDTGLFTYTYNGKEAASQRGRSSQENQIFAILSSTTTTTITNLYVCMQEHKAINSNYQMDIPEYTSFVARRNGGKIKQNNNFDNRDNPLLLKFSELGANNK